jgi:hypothetical protein
VILSGLLSEKAISQADIGRLKKNA